MPIDQCSYRDREQNKFRESGDRANQPAVDTFVSNIVKVQIEEGANDDFINVYDEANSVSGYATAIIIEYTVPVGKELKLKSIEASGENKAVYVVDKNGATESKKRSYYTDYNVTFEQFNLLFNAGDVLKIIVENESSSIADFNANFIGVLQNV
jgi:hypothetical protein